MNEICTHLFGESHMQYIAIYSYGYEDCSTQASARVLRDWHHRSMHHNVTSNLISPNIQGTCLWLQVYVFHLHCNHGVIPPDTPICVKNIQLGNAMK